MQTTRFAPAAALARVAAWCVASVVPLVVLGVVVPGWPGVVVLGLTAVLLLVLLVGAARVALSADSGHLVIRNVLHTTRVPAAEVRRVHRIAGWRRGLPGSVLAFDVDGPGTTRRTVPVVATLWARPRELAPLHLTLRRWSDALGLVNDLARVEYRVASTRRSLLGEGDEVAVPCMLRTTSSRGWGPWTKGWLTLPPHGDGVRATWLADDPTQVHLVSSRAVRPVVLAKATEVAVRGVRFKSEAFYGDDADIVIFTTLRTTTEVALHPAEFDGVVARLRALPPDPGAQPG